MNFITYKDYIKHLKYNHILKLSDTEETYQILESKEKINEVDKKHDKMFRNILSRKNEMANFLNQFLDLKEEIQEKELEQCSTDFITKSYKDRHSDIIYKLKSKPIYFLVEHQSTIDKEMPRRMYEYIGEIMRKGSIIEKTYLKENIYPIVVPIVIYTGHQKWNAKTNLSQKQYQSLEFKKYEINLSYNLVAIQDYSFEELLEKKTLFSSIMIIEKCRNAEELEKQINKIIGVIENTKDKEILSEIVSNIIASNLRENIVNEMLEKINKKGGIGMSPLTKWLIDIQKDKEEIQAETVKNMLKFGETEEKIMKYTGISKKELESIKRKLIYN